MWNRIKSAIYKPIRGLGRIARGNVRQGLRDVGQGIEAAGPALALIPGIGTAAAIGIGAAGKGLATRRGASWGEGMKNAAIGGGQVAAGAALKGIGGRVAGRVGGNAAAGAAGDAAGSAAGDAAAGVAGEAAGGAAGSGFSWGGAADRVSGGLRDLGGWAAKNPEVASNILGTGMEAYGARQAGAAADEQMRYDRHRNESFDPTRQRIIDSLLGGNRPERNLYQPRR